MYKTPIVFNPFSAYFAAPKNGRHLDKLFVIDRYVRLLRADNTSLLHAFHQRWFGTGDAEYVTGKNIAIFSILLVLVTAVGMALWRYISILRINKDLSENIAERKRVEAALQQAQSELEKRVEERTKDLSEEIENRKILEQELAKEKTFLEAVLNNTEDGIVACNKEGMLTLFNRATRKIHGLPEKPIPADEWADYYDLYLADGVTKMTKGDIPLFRALQGEHVSNVEMVIAPKEGEKRTLLAAGQPMVDADNSLLGAVATMHDVTERKKAELLLLNAHKELERKVEERTMELKLSCENLEQEIAEREKIEEALRQSQKMEAIGTLAGGIAHDFNNILSAILGYTEMAQEDCGPDGTVAEDLDKVLQAANRAKDLVQQILTFSRQNEMKRIPLQPASVVKEAIKMLRPSLPATIEIRQDIATSTSRILADVTQFHQVIMNLCANAFHAMENTGGTLTISLQEIALTAADIGHESDVKPGVFVELIIRDTGPGVPKEIQEKVFEPYFTTKETGKGTGMGLAIVHGIVTGYGGSISLSSESGEGTAFKILLPAVKQEQLPETKDVHSVPAGKDRILFIDDEETLVQMGKSMLERLGYHVTVKNNSIEALETFQNEPDLFDLVITDQTMPGMTGSDIARRMLQIRPDLPIILCTGYSSLITEEKARSMGIKGFTVKPFTKKEIGMLIRKVLDKS